MTITTFQQSAPVAVIIGRLKAHCLPGGMLAHADGVKAGLKFFDYPNVQNSGKDNLPSLCLMEVTAKDAPFAGAKSNPGTLPKAQNVNTNIQTTGTLMFLLACIREHGVTNGSGKLWPYGFLDWQNLIKDAIENTAAGVPDASFSNTVSQPSYITVTENAVTDLGWYAVINVTYYPKPTARGTRRDDMSVTF